MKELDQYARENDATDDDPCQVKHCRDRLTDERMWRFASCLENDTSQNEEPGVDFYRQYVTNEPTKVWEEYRGKEIQHRSDMMLEGRRVDDFTVWLDKNDIVSICFIAAHTHRMKEGINSIVSMENVDLL